MTTDPKPVKPVALDLEVQEVEAFCSPGCNTSTTSPRCTCRPGLTTTASLFTAKTAS
jgi:hypothetical protein